MRVRTGETYWRKEGERFLFAKRQKSTDNHAEHNQMGKETERKTDNFMQVQPVLALLCFAGFASMGHSLIMRV